MTNGEKIKAILKPRTDQIRIYSDWLEIEIQSLGINFSCELKWWNEESEECRMNEEELKKAFEEMEKENRALKFRCEDKETYVVSDLNGLWQRVLKMTDDEARAIEWFIAETDVDYYIQKASEVTEEIE